MYIIKRVLKAIFGRHEMIFPPSDKVTKGMVGRL